MGVDKKTTLMLIEVDLQCCRCYKKIKKVLCRIPQIQDQVYNEKENIVLIKVVCCSPEKIKQKIICKGGCAVKNVKEVDQKPKEKPEKPPEKPPGKPKEKPPEKPKEEPTEPPPPPLPQQCPPPHCPPRHCTPPHCPPRHCTPPHCPPRHCPPRHCPPQLAYLEFRTCCNECSEGRVGGPCYSGHGRPPASYDGYYGRPIYDSYGSSGCSIM